MAVKPSDPADDRTDRIPPGSYCYRTLPLPDSGFASFAEFERYLRRKYGPDLGDGELMEFITLTMDVPCPFWRATEHGFVECTYLDRRALYIGDDEENMRKAIAYYGSEEEMDANVTSWLLGDACKECSINMVEDGFEDEEDWPGG